MKSKFYQISQENIETILKFYESINAKLKKYHQKILKYIKYTNDYCSKINQLFNKVESNKFNINNSSEENETMEIDYGINNKEIKNKASHDEVFEKTINNSPISNCIGKINKFFNEYTWYLQLFINSLNIELGNINKYIELINNKINSLKNSHNTQQKNFLSKYTEFESLNKDLQKSFTKIETKLINYCNEKKNKKKKKHELEEKLNLSLSTAVQTEKDIINKFNSLDNFGKIFNDSTNEKINNIKVFILKLFQKFNNFVAYIFSFFKKSFITPMNKIIDEDNAIDEIKVKKEFDNIFEKNIKKIDIQKIKSSLDIYDLEIIKILDENDFEETNEEVKRKKTIFEALNINKDSFEEEDIYYVIKKMYDKFILVNKNMSILDTQKTKMKIKKIINKLISFRDKKSKKSIAEDWNLMVNQKIETKENNKEDNENNKDESNNINNINNINSISNINNINNIKDKSNLKSIIINDDEKEITKKEIDYLISLMNNGIYQRYFLIKINNCRTFGIFEIPLEIFNYIKNIFSAILNSLNFLENDEPEIFFNEEIQNAKLIIILSQTFYIVKDKEKIYIQNELKNEKIFQNKEFWELIIKSSINKEMKNLEKFIKDNIENEEFIKERKKSIAFSQILPYVDTMKGFGVKEDKNKMIISPLIDEYDISEENKEIIFNLLKS